MGVAGVEGVDGLGAGVGCAVILRIRMSVSTPRARVRRIVGINRASNRIESSDRLIGDNLVPFGQCRERSDGGARRVILVVTVGLCRVHGAVGINETNLTEG